jgi:hypothetical protein
VLLLGLSHASVLHAQADSAGDDGDERATAQWGETGLVIGGKLGGGIGAPLNEFGGTFAGELELGYALPLPEPVGRSLEIFASGTYLEPRTDGTGAEPDARLPADGTFSYDVTQQAAIVTLGGRYRFPVTESIAPYGAIGGRMYLMRTTVNGEAADEAFGQNEETAMEFGLHLAGGVDFRLGPGALLAELQLGYAPLDGFVLRDTNMGAMVLMVGYRVMP